jgi:hypothetical protein
VYNPAVAAMIPEVVTEDDLAAANALNSTIENLTVITGPAVGAGLLVLGSPAAVFAVNAGTFAASALIVGRMRARSTPVDVTADGQAGPLRQMVVGIRAIASAPAVRTPVLLCALVSFVYGTDTVLFIGVSEDNLGLGPEGFGVLLAGLGVGGVLMAPAVNKLAGSDRLAVVITAGAVLYCVPTALLTVIHSPELAFALQVVRGGATLVVDVLAVTALQRVVAPDQLARVFGVFFAVILGAISLGTIITPIITSAASLDTALLTMAFVPAGLALLGYPSLHRIDLAAQARVAELRPKVEALRALEIFAAAPQAVLERLAGAMAAVQFAPGETIVREGDPADALFIIDEGRVAVTAMGEGDREQVLRAMGPGTYFGEIGLLERIPRTATVTAVEATSCSRIDGDVFMEALTETPSVRSLVDGARVRLARTHPSRALTYTPSEPAAGQV